MILILAISPLVPVAVIAVTGAAVGVYGWISGWWNGGDYREDPTPDEPPGPGPGPIDDTRPPVTGYVCDRTGKTADADRYHSPPPVIADLRMLGFDLTDDIQSSKSKKEIKRAQRRFRDLGLEGMAGASDDYIDAIVGGCTLLALEAAMEMHGAGTWEDEEG